MWLRLAAFAVLAAAPCLQAAAQSPEISPEVLTLDEAFTRVAQSHPDLRLIDSQHGLLSAEFDRAALRPAYVAGIAIENARLFEQTDRAEQAMTHYRAAAGLNDQTQSRGTSIS